MEKQHQIKRTLAQSDAIEAICSLLDSRADSTRSAFVGAVCGHFGFVDARGKAQTSGCIKALRELERGGHFVLPSARPRVSVEGRRPRRLGQPVEAPSGVPAQAEAVQELSLLQVETVDQMRLWNELMLSEHPQGAGPLVGAQMRYLIGSAHGWLGGLGFGAAALQLADRDRWMGWDATTRRQQLHRVVGMSRFLIRPSVACHNLASRVLGMVLRRLGGDFQRQYGYQPWLVESFVDSVHFSGTCYRAANWEAIGQTRGRGRQDRAHQKNKTVKAIYAYPLASDWRSRLGLPEPIGLPALTIAEGLEGNAWAAQEFAGAALGDERLSQRLVDSACTLAAMPGRAFSGAAQGDRAAVKGHYRLIDQAADSAVTLEAILAPHRQRTLQRMKAQATVLCIQDGSDLNYSGLAQCEGLGVIGSNQTGAQSRGLHLHSTLIVSTEGLPLGVLAAQCSAPIAKVKNEPPGATPVPIEEKKTFAWIEGLRTCSQLAKELPTTRQICVMDREADFFELFDEQRQRARVDLLIRAQHDRCTGEALRLFESARQSPVQGRLNITVPRQSARAKKSKQKARAPRKQRCAAVALRYRRVDLPPPLAHKGKAPITLWVVHVRETAPPEDAKALEWFLLTTREITTVEQAQECLRWYCLRWRIEDWHRVLKSGCRVEALAHRSAERLQRAIAIHLVIAWRIMLMTLLGRECPGLPPDVLFSDLEIEVLEAYAKKKTASAQTVG